MKKPYQIDWTKIIFLVLLILNVTIYAIFGLERKELNNQITELNNQIHTMKEIQITHSQILEGQALSASVIENENAIFVEEESAEVIEEIVIEPIVLTEKEIIDQYINDISKSYNVEPSLIKSIVWHETRYNPNATGDNGNSIGLMQIGTRWHMGRAESLGVSDLYDPYSNILVGVDYVSELLDTHKDPALALMMYNMNNAKARAMYNEGKISDYARSVLERAELIKQGVIQ